MTFNVSSNFNGQALLDWLERTTRDDRLRSVYDGGLEDGEPKVQSLIEKVS